MLEIKSYEDWLTEAEDPLDSLTKYTDYVRSGYAKNGALTQQVEEEIKFGVGERAKMLGLVDEDTTEEDAKSIFNSILGPKGNEDADARFVLDHLRANADEFQPDDFSNKTNVLSKYLDLKNAYPSEAEEIKGSVSEILQDRDLVKKARISAVDRGDFDVVAVDTDKGRQLYSSPYAKADTVRGSLDTLLNSGAISSSDLVGVEDLVSPINGGISTKAKLTSYLGFEEAANSFLKSDNDATRLVSDRTAAATEAKRKGLRTTGETALEGVQAAIALPFDYLAGAITKTFGLGAEEEPNKYGEDASLYDVLSQNKAFADRYSPEVLKEFSDNYEKRLTAPAFRADKPETGIETDALGMPIIEPSLLPKVDLFEKALASSSLNDEQKDVARLSRKSSLEANAPRFKELILSQDSDAVSKYAQARANGMSDSEFVESWVAAEQNYDGFSQRLEQLGMSAVRAVIELPLGLAALAKNEDAAKALGALQKDQADREEYSGLFGDKFGIGFQVLNAVPQVGADIVATIGTGALLGGAKNLVKAGVKASSRTMFRTAAKSAVSELDDAAVALSKEAVEAGGEAVTGQAFGAIGESVAKRFSQATELAPLFAVSFTRSAGSTYGSIYNQLPDSMSHEEKHKQAFGYAIGSGLSTAAITAGMSFLGKGAVEDLATKKLRSMALGEADDVVEAGSRAIPLNKLDYKQSKLLYQNIYNEGQFVKDKVFQDAMNSAIGGAYKNFFRTAMGGVVNEAFEEMLDQSIQIKLEDAALNKETPLVERINQIWTAGVVGGALGGVTESVQQLTPIKKSDVAIALGAKVSGLQAIADKLRKTDSTATLELVQRRMDEANAEVNRQMQLDLEASERGAKRAKTEEGANPYDKPIKFDEQGQGILPIDVTPKAPVKTTFLADVVGNRASVGGYTGTLELSENGGVRLALDDVRKDGITHISVGPRLMPLDKSGVSVNRNSLNVLGQDSGNIKAGTPYVVPDRKDKSKFALPESADNLVILPSLGGIDAILINNTVKIGQENITRPVVLTDPDQIKDALAYYKIDPKLATAPTNVGQLELDLFGEPAPQAPASQQTELPLGEIDTRQPAPIQTEFELTGSAAQQPAATQLELPLGEGEVQPAIATTTETQPPAPKIVSEEFKMARSLMGDNPLVLELRTLASNNFPPDEIKRIATSYTPEQFADLEARLGSVSEFALSLDDSKDKDRQAIFKSVESLGAINDRVKIARIVPNIPVTSVTEAQTPTTTSEGPSEIKIEIPEGIRMFPRGSIAEAKDAIVKSLPDEVWKGLYQVHGTSVKAAEGILREGPRLSEDGVFHTGPIKGVGVSGLNTKEGPAMIVGKRGALIKSKDDIAAVVLTTDLDDPKVIERFNKYKTELSKYGIPVMNGVEFADWIRQQEATQPTTPAAPAVTPTTPAAPATTPAAPPTETPKAKKTRRKVVPTVPETTVVDGAEDPQEDKVQTGIALMNVDSTIKVPEFFGTEPTLPIAQAQQLLESSLKEISDMRNAGATVPSQLLQATHKMALDITAAKKQAGIEITRLSNRLTEIDTPEEPVVTSRDETTQHLLDIINGKKTVVQPEVPKQKAAQPVSAKWAETENGVFRNETEANTFAGFVEGGYYISNFAEFGFLPKKLGAGSIGLNTPRAEGLPPYQVELKQRLAKAIQERFPSVPVPETGIAYMTSKTPWGNMDSAGSSYIKLPFETDADGNPVRGFFTNDPRITAAQIDSNFEVFAPLSLLKDPAFSKNPSIDINEVTGRVNFVKRHPNDVGVYGAGDVSSVGTTAYEARDLKFVMTLDSALIEPAARNLNNAGNSARNRAAASSTYRTFIDDALSEGTLYEETQVGEGKAGYRLSRFGNILINKFNLDEINAEEVLADAQTRYSLDLKEFGLANRIDDALLRKQLKQKDADLSDIDVAKIVLQSMTDKQGVQLKPDDAAFIISKGKSKVSAKETLTNYGLTLHEELKTGRYAKGVRSLDAFVIEAATKAVDAQKRRGTLGIARGSISINAADQTKYPESSSAFGVMSQLFDERYDVRSEVIAMEESNLTQLVNDLEYDDQMYELLHGIVRKQVPDLNPNVSSEDLIDLAANTLSGVDVGARNKIRDDLSKSPSGLKLATRLLEAGWLPPLARTQEIISRAEASSVLPQSLRESIVKKENPTEADIRESVIALRAAYRELRNTKFSISDDVTIAADAARKVNTEELNRLGVRSNDIESVIEAFRQVAESGKPQHRRVAALILEFPEIIRNTNFHIGDFNDVRFAGAFSGKSNLVVINISGHNGRGITDVLLHEFLHAATYNIMSDPKTATQRKAFARITAIRNLTQAQATKMGMESDQLADAFTDNIEFIAYALTDPKFQSLISATTPKDQRSLLRRIVDAILGLFNIDKASKDLSDPLEELISFARMYATDRTFNIKQSKAIRDRATELADGIAQLGTFISAKRELTARVNGEIYFAKKKGDLTDEELALQEELEEFMYGSALNLEGTGYEDNLDRLPESDGWLAKDGTFIPIDISSEGNAMATHRETIFPVLETNYPAEVKAFLKDRKVKTAFELDDNDIYELAKTLGFARIVDAGDEIYVEAIGELSARQRTTLKDAGIQSNKNIYRDLGPNRVRQYVTIYQHRDMESVGRKEVDSIVLSVDPVFELQSMLPEGFSVVTDNNMFGEARVRAAQPTVIRVEPTLLGRRVAGLDKRQARAALRSLLDHELGHVAVSQVFSKEDLANVARDLGADRLQQIAEDYYSSTGLSAQQVTERVNADRKSGALTDSSIAEEWLRMSVTKAATGFTYEEDIKFLSKNPTLLDSFVRAVQAFINKLKQLFEAEPTTETAAMVSRASRVFRKIKKSGASKVESEVIESGSTFGDGDKLLSALDGVIDDDRTMYSIAVLSSNKQKMDGLVDRMQSKLKLYNLPSVLRDIFNMRTGTINTLSSSLKDFIRDFPKLRDAALASGVDIEDIKTLFGTTAPPLSNAVLKDINDKVDVFEANLDRTNLSDEQAEARVLEYRESLKRQERLNFNTAFRKKQQAVEVSIARAGFGGLVNKAVALRKDINKFKIDIGFDDSNDVYLTRAYRFFTTEGWAMAARYGGKITIEGKTVDFDRLRNLAAQSYYEQAEIELKKAGKPFTDADVSARTLEMLDNYLATLETMSKTSDKIAVDSLREDLNRFKPKKDIDSTFRELLGEIDDPMATAANTLFRVGMMKANQDFREQFAKVAVDIGLASKTPQKDFIKWRSESSFSTMGSLAGLWFDPKVAGVLDETFGVNMANHMANSTKLMSRLGRGISRMSGFAVQAKTQFGIGYWPRNSIGGYIMGMAQGIFWNPLSKVGRESVIQSARGAFNRLPTEEAQRNEIKRLIELNVLNDQSQGRVAQDMIRGIIASPEQELLELMADIDEARTTKDAGGVMKRIQQKGTFKGVFDLIGSKYRSATDTLAALDGMIDGLYKVNAYYHERGVIDRHFGKTMTEEQKDEAAARKVKLTFAGHSQVVDAVQSFNKTPLSTIFLPFARWKSEVFRTMLNTTPLALEEISQGGVMARRGLRRLAGFIGTTTAVPTIVGTLATTVFRALTGDEEEKERVLDVFERSALKEALPDWQRGHSLFAQVLAGGKIQFIDMTYILPHSQLTDMVNIITDGIRTGKGIEGSRLASYIANDIIGVQIAATSVGEILSNRDDFGQPIYVENDPAPVKMMRMLKHFGRNAFMPAAAAKIIEASRTGQQNAQEIYLGEILGVRPRTLTFGEVERRGFRNLKALQDESVSIIGELISGRFKDQEDVNEVVNRHQDAMNTTQARMSNFMRTMISLGSTESSVASSAKAFKFSDDTIESAYAGYRIAWRGANAWFEKVYRNAEQSGEQDPSDKVNMIYNATKDKPDIYWINDRIE